MAGLAALMCGVFMIAARLLRLGFVANFLSHSVLIGFLTGVGIQVALGQFGGLFGVSEGSGTTLQKLGNALQAIADGQTSLPTLAVSITVLAVIVGLGRVNKKIPGALIAVVGMIALSYVFDFAGRGITTVGTVPSGLPPIGLPDIQLDQLVSDMSALLPTVFAMFILILAQSAATSRAYAMKYKDRFDENVDLVGLGVGNLAAGLSGTFVVNGSPTKTEMVDSAGGRSQIAQVTTGVIVIATLLFLTVPLSYMPNAVLSAVVFLIGLKLIDYLGMTSISRVRTGEFVVALITAATVVIVGVEQGIILAVILSLILVLMHVYKPHDGVIAIAPDGTRTLGPVDQPVQTAPGLVVYVFGAELFYANATRFTEEVMSIVEGADPPLRWLVLDAAAMGDLDYSGADTLRQVQSELDGRGTRMVLCSVAPAVRALLDAYGLTKQIGAANIFATLQEALRAYPAASDASTEVPGSQPV